MTADKRKVSTDALETLGNIIDDTAKRDAIHLAVEPVIAAHALRPGDDVGFIGDGTVGVCIAPVGIVDPFLKQAVKSGDRFWLVVYPRRVTSLRHVWTHPAFDDRPETNDVVNKADDVRIAAAWIENYAGQYGFSGDKMIHQATEYLDKGRYWIEGGTFEGERLPEDFWNYYSTVTGRLVPDSERNNFFSCSC